MGFLSFCGFADNSIDDNIQDMDNQSQYQSRIPSPLLVAHLAYDAAQAKANTANGKLRRVAEVRRDLAVQQLEINKKKTELDNIESKLKIELADLEPTIRLLKSEFESLRKRDTNEKRQAAKRKTEAQAAAKRKLDQKSKEEQKAVAEAIEAIEAEWKGVK